MKIFSKYGLIAAIILCFTLVTANKAEAGFFDRAKDIYNVPEKIDELQQEYNAAKQVMEEQIAAQREQLEESRKQAEELLNRQNKLQENTEYYQRQNEQYREQNEQYREQTNMLIAENENLLLKMEKMEQDRKSFYQKLVIIVLAFITLLLLYALSVRIWRYIVWRKQGRPRSVQMP